MVCVPQSVGTPTVKGAMGVIADYAPTNAPMVPGIIVHCINEVSTYDLCHCQRFYYISTSRSKIEA